MIQRASYPLYKVALLLARSPAVDVVEFSERWLAAPVPQWPNSLVNYVHNRAGAGEVPIENAPAAPFDAVDELLFSSREAAVAWLDSREFADDCLAPRIEYLGEAVCAISGMATEVYCQPVDPGADSVKILTLPVRRPGMSHGDFVRHWLVTHAGLALAGTGTRERLLRLVSAPADQQLLPPFARAAFDGIGVVQFTSLAAFKEEFSSDHYRTVLAPDEPRFTDTDRSRAMMVQETIVV